MKEHLACGCKPGALCRVGQAPLQAAEQARVADEHTPHDSRWKYEVNKTYLQARGRFIEHLEKGETYG